MFFTYFLNSLELSGFIDFPENGTFFEKYGASVICNDKKKLSTDTLALM